MEKFDKYKCYCNVLHRMNEKVKPNYYYDLVLDKNKSINCESL